MSRKSCVIYDSWADQIINLPSDMAGEYAQKLLKYAIYGEDVSFDNPALNAMFVSVKKRLDEDLEKYQAQVDRMNKCRGRKEVNKKSIRSLSEVSSDNDNDNVNDNDNDKKNKRKKRTFHDFPEREYDFTTLMVKDNV